MKVKLRDYLIKNLKPKDKPYEVMDVPIHGSLDISGLGIRVMGKSDRVVKSFIMFKRFPGSNNPVRRSLGRYPVLTLAKAREKAGEWNKLISEGFDPGTTKTLLHRAKVVPKLIKSIPGLKDLSPILTMAGPGIYFLCFEGAVVYIGQSVDPVSRIRKHVNKKRFDQVFYLSWAKSELNLLESALIRIIQPVLNGPPPLRECSEDDEKRVITQLLTHEACGVKARGVQRMVDRDG